MGRQVIFNTTFQLRSLRKVLVKNFEQTQEDVGTKRFMSTSGIEGK